MSLDAATEPIAVDAEHVKTLIDREEKRFRAARRRSAQLLGEASKLIPLGVPSSHQDAPAQPVFIERGLGSRVWDVGQHSEEDVRRYVDNFSEMARDLREGA